MSIKKPETYISKAELEMLRKENERADRHW